MLRRFFLGVVVLLAVMAAPVYGQEVKLKLKFKEGDSFWVEDVTTAKQSFNLLGQAMQSEDKTTQITKFTVNKVGPEGIELAMKIESIDAKSDGGLGISLGSILEKIKGSQFKVTLTPDGKVTKFEGFAEVAKKLTEGDDDVAKLLKDAITEEMFKKGVEQAYGFLPDGAVKKGDTWKRETKYPAGPFGDFKTNNTFTYKGKSEGGEEIGVKQTMEYVAAKGGLMGGMAKVVKGDLKGDKASGTYIFDAEKGRLISATTTMRISGSLTLDVGGQQAQVDMTMENSGVTKVHDKNPNKQ